MRPCDLPAFVPALIRTAFLLTLCLCLFSFAHSAPDADQPVVSIFYSLTTPQINPESPPPLVETLDNIGLRLGSSNEQPGVPLAMKHLNRFNMIIITTPPTGDFAELLDRYLQAGGGVLYIGQLQMDSYHDQDAMNVWLKQYGAAFAWATIEDEEHTYKNPPSVPWQRSQYLWTTNFADSPITRGVKTLFLENGVFYSPDLRPVRVSADWQVLLSSMPSATAWELVQPLGGDIAKKIEESKAAGAQPLLAVRQVGKGRLAVFGANPGPFYWDLGKQVGAQVSSLRGDGVRTSDWLPLLRNLCLWLSEPARTAGFPGGATERVKFEVKPDWGSRNSVDWERSDIAWPDSEIKRLFGLHSSLWQVEDWRAMASGQQHSYKFLVGAHTLRSGGKGTVAEWKAAALREGFDGVIFREQILEMSKEQWDAFEKECADASDAHFMAVPGQEFTDWEGNRFMRFNQHIAYPNPERLTADKKRVQHQLHFFFDAGWPANFPLLVKGNPTAFWNYRVYSALPVAVYQGQQRIEDNRAEWQSLVQRMEFPTPLGVHLLEDPAEVAGTAKDLNLVVLAPSIADLHDNPRWQTNSFGTGMHISTADYISNGPIIEDFLALNFFRATLGSREVPGSYRYRLLVRARSDAPLALVELWGGGQCLRRYQPKTTTFATTIDEQHDRMRGLYLRIVDTQGREALATCAMVHDKMMAPYWCGDHCNMLPYIQGMDAQGNPAGVGIATHVKGAYQAAGGPGASFSEGSQFIPSGTDTSSPSMGLLGELTVADAQGQFPAANLQLVPDTSFWFGTRDAIITRMAVDRTVDRNKYTNEYYGVGAINGWGPYYRTEPTTDFDIVSDDIDFHRDPGQPGFQLCRGVVRFKHDVTLSDKQVLNLTLTGSTPWAAMVKQGMYSAQGKVAQPGRVEGKLGRGNFLTWPGEWGQGTIFALDDDFAVSAVVDANGLAQGRTLFGYALGNRTFKAGDTFRYQFLIMRWPLGTPQEAQLDAKMQAALNLAKPDSGVRLTASRGAVLSTQCYVDLNAEQGIFRGTLAKGDFGIRIPTRVAGLNPNWTAGVWQQGVKVFGPIGIDPDGYAWTSLDPANDAGEVFIGNVLTCNNPGIILRLFQRSDNGWTALAHNPLDRAATLTITGAAGGPVAGMKKKLKLAPGEEVRWETP